MKEVGSLEGIVEVALTMGLVASGLFLVWGLATGASVVLKLGMVLLISTPVARVFVVTVAMFVGRDWLFGLVSLFVLAVLGTSAWIGFFR